MKILVLEDSSQAIYGGGQKISKIVIEALKDENSLFLIDYQYSLFVKDVKKHMDEMLILNSKTSSNRLLLRVHQLINFFKNIFKIKAFASNFNIDVIYATTKLTLVIAFVLNRCTGLRFIYHAHMAPNEKIIDRICVFLMRYAYAVLVVSNYVRDKINDSRANAILCYNPIEYERGIPKKLIAGQKVKVSFFGTLKKEKGIEDILEAAEIGFNLNKNIQFLIFGDGHLRDHIKNKCSTNVTFMGHVDDVEMHLIENTDILILPSIIPEACPTIILQAMSKGNPIITTCLGGQRELVEDNLNGYLIPIGEPQSIIDSICRLISVPEVYNIMSINNLKKSATLPDFNEYKKSISSFFKMMNSY